MMNYQTYAPPDELRSSVRYFWTLEGADGDSSGKTFSAIPDGCPGVIMVQSDKEAFCMNDGKRLPNIFLYGQTISPSTFSAVGKIGAIGICFQPHALKTIFGIDAGELTDSCTDLTLLGGKNNVNLSDRLLNASTIDDQIRLLSFHLFDQYQNSKPLDNAIPYAISELTRSKGRMPVSDLLQKMNITERTLERRFKESVGITPRLFSRILRFQDSLNHVRRNGYDKLGDIAHSQEYADQSHFIKVFKEFTGLSPSEFRKKADEVVENFPSLKK